MIKTKTKLVTSTCNKCKYQSKRQKRFRRVHTRFQARSKDQEI